ncbi:MAG: hypothetical protein ACLR1T_10885 [Evtepia gabavorous]
MFKIFLSCSHKKTSPEGEWGDARRAGVGAFSSPSSPLERAGTEPSRAGPYFFEEIGKEHQGEGGSFPLEPYLWWEEWGKVVGQIGAWPTASKTNASWPAHQLGRAGEVIC